MRSLGIKESERQFSDITVNQACRKDRELSAGGETIKRKRIIYVTLFLSP